MTMTILEQEHWTRCNGNGYAFDDDLFTKDDEQI